MFLVHNIIHQQKYTAMTESPFWLIFCVCFLKSCFINNFILFFGKLVITHSFHGTGNQEEKVTYILQVNAKALMYQSLFWMEWVKWTLQIWNVMHLLSLLRKHNIYVIKQIFIEYLLISMHWAKRYSDPNGKKNGIAIVEITVWHSSQK